MRCEAREKKESEQPNDLVGFAKSLFAERFQCEHEATFMTPMGPHCDEHTQRLREAARSTHTFLGILLNEKKIDPEEWIRQRIREIS